MKRFQGCLCLLRLDFRMKPGQNVATFAQVLRPVHLAAHTPRRHAVSCTSGELVDGAHAGEA